MALALNSTGGLMFRGALLSSVVALASAPWAAASPPEAPKEVTAGKGEVVEFVVKPDGGKDFAFRYVGPPAAFREMKTDAPGERVFWLIPKTDAPAAIVWWTVGEKASAVTEINRGGAPAPPGPTPDPVDPPKPPAPVPAKSFRVVLIFESGDALTPAQRAVVFGKAVEDYLTANCTGGKNGWRRRDKDSPGEGDPTMAALWAAVQPKVTATPCVAVERDGKVDIIPLEPTPAKMLDVLTKYREGK